MKKSEIILFETKDKEVTLSVPMDGDTVWLTQEQMSSLFDTARSSIAYHIGNIFKEGELEKNTSVEIFDRSTNSASRPPKYYNLDVIISVGYRVKSKRGIEFRQWASKILKQLRKKTGLSQSKFSAKFGIPVRTLQQWEQGISAPSEYLVRMMEYIMLLEENVQIKDEESIRGKRADGK